MFGKPGAGQSPLLKAMTARELEGKPTLPAIRADGESFGKFRIEGTRLSAKITASRRDHRERREAVVREGKSAGTAQEFCAKSAACGKAHTGKSARELLQPRGQSEAGCRSRHGLGPSAVGMSIMLRLAIAYITYLR
jgi:hypothetical protein